MSLFSCLSRKRSINVKIFKRNMFLKSSWREHTTMRNRVKEGEVSVSVILSGLSALDVQRQHSLDSFLFLWPIQENEDNKCFTNICYRGQITVKKREILSKEHFSVLPLIVFGGIISSLLNTVVFTLSSQSSLSISVQLRSSYISKRFIILRRLPGGQRSFHFDQEKKGSPAQLHKVGWKICKFVAWLRRISFQKAGWQRWNNLYRLVEQCNCGQLSHLSFMS